MHLSPSAVSLLGVVEFALLMQWILEQRGLETDSINDRDGGLDLVLTNEEQRRSEFARAYYDEYGVPMNVLWELLNKLKGTQFTKIHCFTLGTLSASQKKAQGEFPLALNLVEREELERYLREAQQSYRTELAPRSARRAVGAPRKRRTFIQRLLMWLRGSR